MDKILKKVKNGLDVIFRKYPECDIDSCTQPYTETCRSGKYIEKEMEQILEKRGIRDTYERLDDTQRKTLKGLLCRITKDENRDLLLAGAGTILDSGILHDDRVLYAGIRGSVSRGDATKEDDCDIYIMVNSEDHKTIRDYERHVTETSLKYAKGLKKKGFEREEDRLVTCIAIPREVESFLERPAYIDMELCNAIGGGSRSRSAISRYLEGVNILMETSGILYDLQKDPLEFKREILKAADRYKNKSDKRLRKEYAAKLIPTISARLHGIKLKDMVGVVQHYIIFLRDVYLLDWLEREMGFPFHKELERKQLFLL